MIDPAKVVDGCVLRVSKAYPVYDGEHREAIAVIRAYLDELPNLQLVGRNGQHRYNNQDHSMLTAVYAARNIAGESSDIWDVNLEESYHEEVREERAGDRSVPARPARTVDDELIRSIYARYDPVALGVAVGALLGVGLFMATALLLIRGSEVVGPSS